MATQVQVEISGQPGLPGLSTFHFIGDADQQSAEAVTQRVIDFFAENSNNIADGTEIRSTGLVTVFDDATGDTIAAHVVPTAGFTASSTGDRLPAGTQGLLHVRTGVYVAGREIRGRIYHPAPTEGTNSIEGAPTSAYRAAITTAANLHLFGVPDFPLAVWSPTHLQNQIATGVTASPHWARLSSRRT